MKTLKLISVLSCVLLFVTGCDMIDYHPYDTQVRGHHNINAENIARIEEQCAGRDSIKFALIADTQRWYDETNDAVRDINSHPDIDFVIHAGDISDFGVTKEFEVQRDILDKLRMPYVVIIGNHDCLGNGEHVFEYIFGAPNFSFNAGDTHFLCLNTNSWEYDHSTEIPDFDFIKEDCKNVPAGIRRTVVGMHVQPKSDQFPNQLGEYFQAELHKFPGLSFCICGHGHTTEVNDHFNDGILYFECGAAKKREYIIFTLTKDGKYTHEVVRY